MLQDTINSISDEDVLIVVGDWNARVGSTDHERSNTDSSYVHGKMCWDIMVWARGMKVERDFSHFVPWIVCPS